MIKNVLMKSFKIFLKLADELLSIYVYFDNLYNINSQYLTLLDYDNSICYLLNHFDDIYFMYENYRLKNKMNKRKFFFYAIIQAFIKCMHV